MDDIDRLFEDRRKAVELRKQQQNQADQAALNNAALREKQFSDEVKPFVAQIDAYLNKMRAKIETAGGVFHWEILPPLPLRIVREALINVALPIRTGKRAPTFAFSVSVDESRDCIVSMFEKHPLGGNKTEISPGSLSINLGRFDGTDVMPEIQKLSLELLTYAWDKTEPLL
ncbi:hypothetical protein [Burkholderia cepacia]|uniref:hypothetical protein n=1 Tax=Burkholderia cepacia TaxID=292 RepID=UPI000F5FD879|nr:hypothetical protein [Burkholderia cepacia]